MTTKHTPGVCHFTLEEKFSKAQQELIDAFKVKIERAAKDAISDLYADVSSYAVSDAHLNFHNYLRDEFRESLKHEISQEFGHYSWAHSIRMELLKQHPETLRNKIIDDLQDRIKSLEGHIEDMRRWR